MTNEQKAARLEEIANYKLGCDGVTISILREAAQLMRERGEKSLLTRPDWKTMYEAQERDMEALRKRVGELEADLATAGSNVHTLRDELQEAQQQMAADAMLIAEAQRGAEIVADTERRLESRIADLEAERDAARAGEARAVEAIKGLLNQLHEFDFEIDGSVEFFDSVQQCRDATDNTQPALDWLAQQRREAAARELEQLMESEWKWEEFELKAIIHARIAALTNQQPTACPRSEVRGKERFRA